ncbi:MAG: UDP-N-acetylmuramoylalanyl-D-glutamyl-2,6-diaminopimelate--D-alanyl-D-alanine ligase [Hyphomicrobiaceae bacterium]|nr:UDP-N-acetylmuramoylalanyl-D-glutamyl-2,6-diaminopimelate--D-alanyl-D-alanine ligase [Hyphomicrobiaceae bacterium]
MSDLLWTWGDLVAATDAVVDGADRAGVTGVSIDTRTLAAGDLFAAIRDQRDGHDFVEGGFKAGAAAALVAHGYARRPGDATLLRVDDPLRALARLAQAARVRSNARVVAVTGSVGKTGTKEMLRLSLSELGRTHAAEKSYNNHWGVPLTLARMPADAAFGVFEIGMNHAGEIAPLADMVRPHVAVITTVEPVHVENFADGIDGIAAAKAEILAGLVPGGTAVLPWDNAHFGFLRARAVGLGANVLSFGFGDGADVRALQVELSPRGSSVIAGVDSQRFPYKIGAPGEHYVRNSLAVLAATLALKADAMRTLPALARIAAPEGRGARHVLPVDGGSLLLIDESYNANPASVRAALAALGMTPREEYPRRIAVLGDMLELGPAKADLHRALKEAVDAAGVDLVLACGPMMRLLLEDLDPKRRAAWAETSAGLVGPLVDAVKAGDVVMIKGSLGSRMAPLVEALLDRFAGGRAGG